MNIPFVDLKTQYNNIKSSIDAAIDTVIDETAFIGGKHVNAFEEKFAKVYGVPYCVSTANGTDSLYIIMKALNIGRGDEVITVANSWISSSETITQAGARPVFVDIHPDYYTINEDLIEEKITSRTKAIIPVHLYGQVCDMDKLKKIADKHQLYIIEDCAQSHFSEFKGARAGTFGIAGSFSFYPGKNLGAYGDAGGLITKDEKLATQCKMFARHGALVKHEHKIEGINSRLDGLQAAILSVKLDHIHEWTSQRIANAAKFTKLLKDIPELVVPAIRSESVHSFHLYVIRAKAREALQLYLKEKGIETAIHYPIPLPFLPAYSYLHHTAAAFPVSNAYSKEILSIPLYPELTERQIVYISDTIRAFYKDRSSS
jgi:dTDP-4-amino-4,6-dideoxygalactose transaminase